MASSRKKAEPDAHQSFVGTRRIVRGKWEKVRNIGADVDSFGDDAEDDAFRLSGGLSGAIARMSTIDPFDAEAEGFYRDPLSEMMIANERAIDETKAEEEDNF